MLILDKLDKYAIRHEYKSKSSSFIHADDVPIIKFLEYIITSADRVPVEYHSHKIVYGSKKEVFSLFILE